MASKKIVLVSLGVDERQVPPPEQQLLGAVIVSQVQMAAMASLENPTEFFLHIDESQHFVTTSLDKVLDGARKYGLYLTIANQHLSQLQGSILESVVGNVGATVVFQVGPHDARALSPYLAPEFKAEDLMNLDLYRTAVKMRLDSKTLPAFDLATRPRPGNIDEREAKAREEMIRARSIARYTPKTREEVLDWLAKRYPRSTLGKGTPDDMDLGSADWVVS